MGVVPHISKIILRDFFMPRREIVVEIKPPVFRCKNYLVGILGGGMHVRVSKVTPPPNLGRGTYPVTSTITCGCTQKY
jgi:hypothetical protein